ncbi:MAG: M1 family aminopeptidase, partial [Butyricimonas faecihominis]
MLWIDGNYTGCPVYNVVAIPDFQYGGMEHPGAVYYRASTMFLDRNADLSAWMKRSDVIAHETAHMWFGDYVTMRWFNDVWLKEVFAGFMSDKIMTQLYPDVNHRLNFFL